MKPADSYTSFSDINERLERIVQQTADDTLSLDDALALYEEAVQLGLQVSSLIENTMDQVSDSSDVRAASIDTPVALKAHTSAAHEAASAAAPSNPAAEQARN